MPDKPTWDEIADLAAGQKARVFAAFKHAGKPVKRRVGIASAHRFVQGGNQVVMLLAGFVVFGGEVLHRLDAEVAGKFFRPGVVAGLNTCA